MKKKTRAVNWRDVADKLAAALPRERLHPAVRAWAERASPRVRWAVALSGGADSVATLLLVWAHWPARRSRLRALHFDHQLRGRESRADAEFCRRLCAALKIEFATARWTRAHRGASEAEAREARMSFFEKQARVLWLGHQQDDVAETMLMRLARGSGSGGLAAPRPVQAMPGRRIHLRPMLALKKVEIIAALEAAGAVWREDATNLGADFFRNRVRLQVMPAWAGAAQRDAVAGAARSRALLEEDDRALDAWLDELAPIGRAGELLVTALAGKPRAILRRALHRWLLRQRGAGDLSRAAFDALLDAVAAGISTRHSLGREGFAVIRAGVLRFERGKVSCKFQRPVN
jgi:tRNA(Ile)-lysidine synthase